MGKYYYNKDFFEFIDTEEKAYWLGFLYADGCINRFYRNEKLKSMDLELTLCKNDESHLVKFLNAINGNIEIKERSNNLNGKLYESNRIVVCCTKMCRDLINKGCIPQKTLSLKFPNYDIVPKQLMKHFIRGYFDGDGCIYTNKNKISINFVGTSDMLLGISDFLLKEKVLKTKNKLYDCGNAKEMYIYGTDNIKDVLNYLYNDSTVFLDRKYKKYEKFYMNYLPESKRGVYFDKNSNKWISAISKDGIRTIIGRFERVNDAIEARKNVEIEMISAD